MIILWVLSMALSYKLTEINIAMNINILKEKTKFYWMRSPAGFTWRKPKILNVTHCEQFLQACCEVHVSYKMACRASSRATFMDGLRQVVSAAIRLHYWIHCMEAYRPNSSGELYSIKGKPMRSRPCYPSIKTMEKKKTPLNRINNISRVFCLL